MSTIIGRGITVGGKFDFSAATVVPEVLMAGYTAYDANGELIVGTRPEYPDGEYGSKVIAGTKTKGSFVRFDGLDWIVANVSGNTYTLMLKKMTEITAFGSRTTYSGSAIALRCMSFQNNMSANALSVVNSKYVEGVTAKVWIAKYSDIASWTDSNDPTSSAWSGIRKWTGSSEDDYAVKDIYDYWCSDPSYSSRVWRIIYNGHFNFGISAPSTTVGFRPCIEVTQ